MVKTFDALAKFGDETPKNNDTDPQTGNTASVDVSAIVNRLNELETAINEMRKEQQQSAQKTEPQQSDQTGDTSPSDNDNNNQQNSD